MKTVALTPYFGPKDPVHDDCVRALRAAGTEHLERRGIQYIDQARSILIEDGRAAGADVVVFIDHDMVFLAEDVERLAQVAREEQAVVAVTYPRHTIGGSTPVGKFAATVAEVIFYEGGGLYEAEVVGMGFTAIPLAALGALDHLPVRRNYGYNVKVRSYFHSIMDDEFVYGDDVSFSRRFRAAGGQLLFDTRIRVLHRSTVSLGLEHNVSVVRPQRSIRANLVHSRDPSPEALERAASEVGKTVSRTPIDRDLLLKMAPQKNS